jgi:hypothetical protein
LGSIAAVKKLVIICTNVLEISDPHPFLQGMVRETKLIAKFFATQHVELVAKFSDRAMPLVSFLAALDWHWEAQITDKMDSEHFANEWDGVVAFAAPGDGTAYVAMADKVHPSTLSCKTYPTALELAVEKFPQLDWTEISAMKTKVYMAKLTEVQSAIWEGKPGAVRNIDTVVGEVMIGRQDCSLSKTKTSYEVFREGCWEMDVSYDDLCCQVKRDLADTFGRTLQDASGDEYRKPPPPPFQQDQFVRKIAECTVKYLNAPGKYSTTTYICMSLVFFGYEIISKHVIES